MPSSGILRRVALVSTDISWERLRSVLQLLVAANVLPSSPIVVTLTMNATRSSETLILTKATRYNIPEDGILQRAVHLHIPTFIEISPIMLVITRANRRKDTEYPLFITSMHLCREVKGESRVVRFEVFHSGDYEKVVF
jgi:hypothetical protein